MLKKISLSALAFALMTSVATAEPIKMTDPQMDKVVAAALVVIKNNNVAVLVPIQLQAAVCAVAVCKQSQWASQRGFTITQNTTWLKKTYL